MKPFLQFQQVSFSYPRQEKYALSNLSFSINHAEFLGILGADDAGKTTIAKLSNGLILPLQGRITLRNAQSEEFIITSPGDTPLTPLKGGIGSEFKGGIDLPDFRRKIGVVFSDPENQIVGTTVEEDVAFGLENLRVPSREIRTRVDLYLKRVGLLKYARRSPHKLSGGEQQKLCFASVLAMEPECLVFDEPLSFLDGKSRKELLEFLAELNAEGKTILYLTTDPEELLYAHRVIILYRGTILTECSIAALWNNPAMLEKAGILASDMIVFRHRLRQRGYFIHEDSLTPEAIVNDICRET